METSELLALRMRQLEKREEDLAAATEALRRARCTSREQFMRRYHHRIQKKVYEPGELVLMRNSEIEESLAKMKTVDRYLGPYQVVKRTRMGNYVLQELDGALLRNTIAAFRVIGYISRDDPEIPQTPPMTFEPESESESEPEPDTETETETSP
ncbi:hypothetical protein CCMSSC00406_0007196 [Pleurotus cornucopiae]|uniref:Uncharacterized protein n=1 Tax=Pleurotus cornucopiae TaxID=5321 RepID=A0ACB7ITH2_PLECO|nr:hypothetical protein CCMSSC00406_0007196 [Pleurotus cornucopiae]